MAKVLASLDDELLRRVDRRARSLGLSRSAYLSQLAERDLAHTSGPGRSRVARRALARLDRVLSASPAGESTVDVRAEREAR
jgi:hypothetical protein